MTMQAVYRKSGEKYDYTPDAARVAGEVLQLPDGRAAAAPVDIASGELGALQTCGLFDVLKAASVVILDGAPIWWDHSANAATPVPQFGDRDFYLGAAVGDFAASVETLRVALNVLPKYIIDINGPAGGGGGGGDTVLVAAGAAINRGGMLELAFTTAAEAQKADWLSRRSFPKTAKWILEAMFEVATAPDDAAVDLDIGVANATHASNFETIDNFVSIHLDGDDLNIDVQSDDGATDVAPVDSTIDWAAGTPVHIVLDGRDPDDVQVYVNGVLVLPDSTFTLAAASNALKAIVHLEKSSNDSPGAVQVDMLRVRIMD